MGPFCHLEIESVGWAPISKTALKLVGRGIISIRCVLTWSPMSTFGGKADMVIAPKADFHCDAFNVAFGSKADMPLCTAYVRF